MTMKKLIFVSLIAALPAFCWNPLKTVENALTGKYGIMISLGAVGAANAADYKTTIQVVSSGAGYEANPILQNSQGVLSQNRLVVAKILSFAAPATEEAIIWPKMSAAQKQKYGKWIIIGNWVDAIVVGGIAAHNREIYTRAQ